MSKPKAQVRRAKYVPQEYRDPTRDYEKEAETLIWTDEKGRPISRVDLLNYDTSDRTIFEPTSNSQFNQPQVDHFDEAFINQEKRKQKALEERQTAKDIVSTALDIVPIVGDIKGGYEDIILPLQQGNYLTAGIGAGLMFVPNFIEKPLKWIKKLIPNNHIAKPIQELDYPFDFQNVKQETVDRVDGVRIGYKTSGIKTRTKTTQDKYWKEDITDINNIPPRKLQTKRKTIETVKEDPKLKEILNFKEIFIPLGTKVDNFNPDELVNFINKDIQKHVRTYYDLDAPITSEVRQYVQTPVIMANPVGTNKYQPIPNKTKSYVYYEVKTPVTYTLMHKSGGKL